MLNPQPKARPKLLDKRDAQRELAKIDRAERVKCKARSGGRCEVILALSYYHRCIHRATENHHLKSGIGVRNRGVSVLAEYRLQICKDCHRDIHGHVLVPIGDGRERAATVRFERRT